MKSFKYVIKDKAGIHARPAGIVVKEVKKFESEIRITAHGKTIDASDLMKLMAMGIKCGDEIAVEISGADEETAEEAVKKVISESL